MRFDTKAETHGLTPEPYDPIRVASGVKSRGPAGSGGATDVARSVSAMGYEGLIGCGADRILIVVRETEDA